jgi:glyoxylase-like metal-dependent hydrolase (beta-lactamase superfamily II)
MSHPHDHHQHESIRLVSAQQMARSSAPVHRIGRRRFLTELGRNTFAVAILGGSAVACSNSGSDGVTAIPPESGDRPLSTTGSSVATPSEPAADDRTGLLWSQVSLGSVSAYVLVRGNQAAVVDTGNPGSADQIGETLATLGVTYDDVRHVVLTHRHPDHVGSLSDVLGRASSSVAYAGAADIGEISSSNDIRAVADGDDVFGLQVIETPGHTPGSISLLDVGIGLLIAGDALNGNGDGTAITGPADRYSSDMPTAEASVVKLTGFDFEAAAFGHGNPVVSGADRLVAELARTL